MQWPLLNLYLLKLILDIFWMFFNVPSMMLDSTTSSTAVEGFNLSFACRSYKEAILDATCEETYQF